MNPSCCQETPLTKPRRQGIPHKFLVMAPLFHHNITGKNSGCFSNVRVRECVCGFHWLKLKWHFKIFLYCFVFLFFWRDSFQSPCSLHRTPLFSSSSSSPSSFISIESVCLYQHFMLFVCCLIVLINVNIITVNLFGFAALALHTAVGLTSVK